MTMSRRLLKISQKVPTASCPGAGYHWKEPGSILLTPSLLLAHTHKINSVCGNLHPQRGKDARGTEGQERPLEDKSDLSV